MLTPSADERPDIFQVISQKKIARISFKYSKIRLLVWHSSWGEPRSVLFKIFTNFRFSISPLHPHPQPESSSLSPLSISSIIILIYMDTSIPYEHHHYRLILSSSSSSHQVPSFSSLPSSSPSPGAALEPPKPRAALPATPVKVIKSCQTETSSCQCENDHILLLTEIFQKPLHFWKVNDNIFHSVMFYD